MDVQQIFIECVLQETYYDLITIGKLFFYRVPPSTRFIPVSPDYVSFGSDESLYMEEVASMLNLPVLNLAIVHERSYDIVYLNKVYKGRLELMRKRGG